MSVGCRLPASAGLSEDAFLLPGKCVRRILCVALRKGVVTLKTPKMKRKKKKAQLSCQPCSVNLDFGVNSGISQPM